jgi:hypothetical protein
MEQIERVYATRIIVKVKGFYDAKDWMYRILRAGIATCSSCDEIAKRIYWVDRAEWYFECDEHYSSGEMWVGNTGWNPREFSKRVLPDLAQVWIATLEPDEQKLLQLEKYEATDWYAWLTDEWKARKVFLLRGNEHNGTRVTVIPLKNGQFAYEITHYSPGYSYGLELTAPFDSIDEAVKAAKVTLQMQEAGQS